jgi:hypothetical protein
MQIAIGIRFASAWAAVAAAVLLAACNSSGSSGTSVADAAARDGEMTRRRPSHTAPAPAPAPTTANVTVSWTAPTENTNGTAVGALGGYVIYYGTSATQYSTTISVANPGVTTYVVDGLDVGKTYYFAVAAVSAAGVESALSSQLAARIS